VKLIGTAVLALAAVILGSLPAAANDTKREPVRFGALEAKSVQEVRDRAKAWFDGVVRGDPARAKALERIWADAERPVIDRLADTFSLADEAARKLLAGARDPLAPAPTDIPALLKDEKRDAFFRANLALAYARALSQRRVYEEALDSLRLVRPEQTIEPATYLFHRAVAEHALLLKKEAKATIQRLVDDAVDAPERYKIVGMLMLLDMEMWKEKDLAAVARKMSNVERRLELARAGETTRRLQREIVARLDELIKELENSKKPPGDGPPKDGPPGDGPPGDGPPKKMPGDQGGDNPSDPLKDSKIVGGKGTGRVERAEAMQQIEDLIRNLAPAHQEAYRNYFRNLGTAPRKE
jgi:hypothetical protein